jgi:hypothetical protein
MISMRKCHNNNKDVNYNGTLLPAIERNFGLNPEVKISAKKHDKNKAKILKNTDFYEILLSRYILHFATIPAPLMLTHRGKANS